MSTLKLTDEDIPFMSETSAAVLEGGSRTSHIILWCSVVFVIIALVWANFATLDEITRGAGKVIPSSDLQVIQNLEGGIIKEILVREGNIVEHGQPLMIIDDTQFRSDKRVSEIKSVSLKLKIARLEAEAEGKDFRVSRKLKAAVPALVQEEMELYEGRQNELQVKIKILENELLGAKQELAEMKRKNSQLEKSHNLVARELKLTYPLVKEGAVSEVELLRLERTVNDLKGEWDGTKLAIPKLEAEVKGSEHKVKEAKLNFQNEAQAQLTQAKSELTELFQSYTALEDRVDRTTIRSPVRGVVNQINTTTVGGIIQPGQTVMEIVPLDDTLLIEAEIKPQDIGFLKPNLKAKVKLTAYDFSIYGGLEATVEHISADTVINEKKESVYMIRLRTKQNYLEKDGKKYPIITGMRATVDILTGKKTVLDYILKPILKTKQQALTER